MDNKSSNFNFNNKKVKGPYKKDTSKSKKRILPFIKRMVSMLADSQISNVISYEQVDGFGIVTIIDIHKLEAELLPRYFRHGKLSSFIRQLNIHGFRRLIKKTVAGKDCNLTFINKYFIPSNSAHLSNIRRNADNGGGPVRLSAMTSRIVSTLEDACTQLKSDPNLEMMGVLSKPPLAMYSEALKAVISVLSQGSPIVNRQALYHPHPSESEYHSSLQTLSYNYIKDLRAVTSPQAKSTLTTPPIPGSNINEDNHQSRNITTDSSIGDVHYCDYDDGDSLSIGESTLLPLYSLDECGTRCQPSPRSEGSTYKQNVSFQILFALP